MQAIATLIHDDPYLKMPRAERIALRKRRRQMFRASALPSPVVRVKRILPVVAQDPIDLAPIHERDLVAEWIKKQREQPLPHPVASMPVRKILAVEIQRAVAIHFEVPWLTMISSSRFGRVVLPRQIAMYLAKTISNMTLPEIGRRFGGRDHTTVLHAVKKIQKMINADPVFQAGVERLRSAIVERRA